MFANFKKHLITATALCIFSLTVIAADTTPDATKTLKVKTEQPAPKAMQNPAKPKGCDFRISIA